MGQLRKELTRICSCNCATISYNGLLDLLARRGNRSRMGHWKIEQNWKFGAIV